MRLPGAAATLVSAVLLLLSLDAVAYADPSFVLSRSEARAGDSVQFSIAGAEDRATYDVEVGGREVAEGSVPAGKSVSGTFTMPNFGGTAKTVTVRAEVAEPDETTVLTRSLQYLAPVQAATGPTAAEPAPAAVPTPAAPSAPSIQGAPSPGPTSRARSRKRRARRSPESVRERRSRKRPPFAPVNHGSGGTGSPVTSPTTTTTTTTTSVIDAQAIPRSREGGKAPSTLAVRNRLQSERRGKSWREFPTTLTTPLATSLPASSVADNGGAGWTGAVAVLALLALSALVLRSAQRYEDDEVLQGTPYVPRD